MKYTETIERLASTGPDSWAVYRRACQMADAGHDVIEMAIGEPDVPTPAPIVSAAIHALENGRTNYAASAGEEHLRDALAQRYSGRLGRPITPDQIVCLPGTQTALYAVLRAIAGPGDEVIVGDPMYATYGAVIAATGATAVPIPLRAAHGFRLHASDVAAAVTRATTVLLLNTPHNPTGAVLSNDDIEALGRVAIENDLWILVDEVYEEMVFGNEPFVSPLAFPNLMDRAIAISSISKSHAAPGFRSGWCVASEAFCERLLPLAEAMLFGNQPFIADATAVAVSEPSPVARGMVERFEARAHRMAALLHAHSTLQVQIPGAGMFALVDVSSTGLTGEAFANSLLDAVGVGVMPGASFGASLGDWIRVSLTRPDDQFDEGCRRLVAHANTLTEKTGSQGAS